jgi:hypothetical protein
MTLLQALAKSVMSTVRDVLPIIIVVVTFQLGILRRPIPDWRRVIAGFVMLLVGLAIFLVGLDLALFPLGGAMAEQLAAPEFVQPHRPPAPGEELHWTQYYWTYAFALLIGFSAVMAEPGLSAVAARTEQLSGGTIRPRALRTAIAIGSGFGIALGAIRIVTGLHLLAFVLPILVIIALLTYLAPRAIMPLAYDSGVIATSTMTVPLVTALGVGLAEQIPDRHPLVEGFGTIALAMLCPMITVMAYALFAQWWINRPRRTLPAAGRS